MSTLRRRQALFDEFNKVGSTLTVSGAGFDPPVNFGLIDSYRVTRVAGDVFWLMFKVVGYQEAFQYTSTIKVLSWSQEDGWELDLVDDEGRRFHAELIFPELEPGYAKDWRRWRSYKAANLRLFRTIDADLLVQHKAMAEGWL